MACRAIIITWANLSWLLLSIISTLIVVGSLFSPKWIVGHPSALYENGTVGVNWPSVGVISRCLRVEGKMSCAIFILDGLGTDSSVFPTAWKISFFSFCTGLTIMTATSLTAVISVCVQRAFGKSIFTLTGTAQAAAGLLFVVGILFYAGGWGSARMVRLCGREAQPFYIGDCTLGWSSYTALLGTVLTMVTACTSVKAEKATSTDRIRQHVETGEVFICLI